MKAPQGRLNRECSTPSSLHHLLARWWLPAADLEPSACHPGALSSGSETEVLGKEEGPGEEPPTEPRELIWHSPTQEEGQGLPSSTRNSASPSSHGQGPKENRSDRTLGPVAPPTQLVPLRRRATTQEDQAEPAKAISPMSVHPSLPASSVWSQFRPTALAGVCMQKSTNKKKHPRTSRKQGVASPREQPKRIGSWEDRWEQEEEPGQAPHPDSAEEGRLGE